MEQIQRDKRSKSLKVNGKELICCLIVIVTLWKEQSSDSASYYISITEKNYRNML